MMPWIDEPKPWWKNRFKRIRYALVTLHFASAAFALASISAGMPPWSIGLQLALLWMNFAIHTVVIDDVRDRIRELNALVLTDMQDHGELLKSLQPQLPGIAPQQQ